jgi:secreted Zn-dependent insulinase-like peptidase
MSKMRNNNSSNHTKKDKDDDIDINYGFPVDLSLLTYRQRKIVEGTRRGFLSKFLKNQGLLEEVENDKADLIEDETDRIIHDMEIMLKHHQRIQKIEINLIRSYENYSNEIDIHKREIIREHIIAVQYYLSTYYEALKDKLLTI